MTHKSSSSQPSKPEIWGGLLVSIFYSSSLLFYCHYQTVRNLFVHTGARGIWKSSSLVLTTNYPVFINFVNLSREGKHRKWYCGLIILLWMHSDKKIYLLQGKFTEQKNPLLYTTVFAECCIVFEFFKQIMLLVSENKQNYFVLNTDESMQSQIQHKNLERTY